MLSIPASKEVLEIFGSSFPIVEHPVSVSRNVRDQMSHPYKTTGKVIVVYLFIFSMHVRTVLIEHCHSAALCTYGVLFVIVIVLFTVIFWLLYCKQEDKRFV